MCALTESPSRALPSPMSWSSTTAVNVLVTLPTRKRASGSIAWPVPSSRSPAVAVNEPSGPSTRAMAPGAPAATASASAASTASRSGAVVAAGSAGAANAGCARKAEHSAALATKVTRPVVRKPILFLGVGVRPPP